MTTLLEKEGSVFTRYPGYAVEYRDASHRYWIIRGQERFSAISVTSALKVIDKPQLVGWAERVGIEGALKLERSGGLQYGDGSKVPISEAARFVREAGQGADAKRDAGGDRGTALHDALQAYCEVGAPPRLGDFEPQVRGYVQALCRWLLAARPEPILVEKAVGSAVHGYAGTFDLLADIGGRKVLCDLKTSKRPYAEQHMQVAAYMHALSECEGDEPETWADEGLIVLLSPEGSYRPYKCRADAKHFLSVLACHRALTAVRNAVREDEA